MAIQAYRLTFVLRLAGSDSGTTQQTVTIAVETPDEAVELAQFYRAGLPSESVCSAELTDTSGAEIWSERDDSRLRVKLPQKDQT
jgi:hypothetical protein